VSLHSLFGTHVADVKFSHWEGGDFVTRCTTCGAAMVKPPGLPWRLRTDKAA
jgi:hypothetical protein